MEVEKLMKVFINVLKGKNLEEGLVF